MFNSVYFLVDNSLVPEVKCVKRHVGDVINPWGVTGVAPGSTFWALFRVLRILAVLVRVLPWDPLLAAKFRLVVTGGVGPAGVCLSESRAGSCTLATVKLPL